jgi:ankyrin repeat protein
MKKKYFLILSFLMLQAVWSQEPLNIFDVARKGTVEQAKTLLESNPKILNAKNEEGYTPLILAAYHSNNEVAKFLIENGSDTNGTSSMGTPLMAAVVKGNAEIVKILLDKKADPNIADANGTTALIYATMFKNYDITTQLIKARANPEFKDNRGNSAMDYAILADDDKLIQILKTK